MGVTSVVVNGLEVHDGSVYACGADTLTMLEAADPQAQVMVDMARRHPEFIRNQPLARSITLVIWFLDIDANQRMTDYVAFRDACTNDPASSLFALEWTDTGITKRLLVARSSIVPSRWITSASAELVAPDPTPVIV